MADINKNLKSICSFYASEWHLVTMLLPNLDQKINKGVKVTTILEKDLTKEMETLLTKLHLEDKKEIINIGWQKSNLEDIKQLVQNNDCIIINGTKEFIEKTREKTGKIELDVEGNKSEIQITKVDSETNQPLEGVKFSITYDDGCIFKFTTDENGIANCKGLHQGKARIKEIETKDGYILDEQEQEIKLGYGEHVWLTFYNDPKKGEISVNKVDKDDENIKLEGVEFDIIDESGNVIQHLITDSDGKASAKVNIGNYKIRETKTKQEYKIGKEESVTVNWNEVVELKIENEKKKGQIKIIKKDKEYSNIGLKGVEFEIRDKDEKLVKILKTDEKGEAITPNLPIGNYCIQEIKTLDNYILNEDKVQVTVKDDNITEVVIQNEKKRGQIQINKTSEDKNNVINKEIKYTQEVITLKIFENANEISKLEAFSLL